MKILHIACGFSYSNIYENLFEEQYRQRLQIEVYVPQHMNSSVKKINTTNYPYKIHTKKIIGKLDKYIYFSKILKMKKDVELNFNLSHITNIHAHSLFSDGGVAYEIFKKHKIPYVVAIRDTDVNQYFKKAKHLKPYSLNILKHACSIVFLSKSYKENVIERFIPVSLRHNINKKSIVIPNGISKFWLDNAFSKRPSYNKEKEQINLLFVGKIIRRKNIESIIRTSELTSRKINKKINLVLIGEIEDSKYFKYLKNLGRFKYIDHCSKEELINYYRNADIFIMPSITETFGLVYAEALSQGLPIIYTYGQGFDGHFKEGMIGYGVNPLDIEDIFNKIYKIINNYDFISTNSHKKVSKFDWGKITKTYKKLYEQTIENGCVKNDSE